MNGPIDGDAGRGLGLARGRGAVGNPPGRYAVRRVEPDPEGVAGCAEGATDDTPSPATTVTPEATRRILTRNDSPDIPFDASINPYRGCEHGCIYCFARPTHSWLDLSPGLDFERRIVSKPLAPELLRRELARPGYRPTPLALGANTDPWQPVEAGLRLTRRIVGVLAEHEHPVVAVTKSALIARDLDLLGPMAERRLAAAYVSVTTLDPRLARTMEPRAPAPHRRLATIRALAEAGVPVGVLASPMIPALNEAELEAILRAARDAGATTASFTLVRLPHELGGLFAAWLREHHPHRAARVLGRLREMHGGRLDDPRFGHRMRGQGPYADALRQRFDIARRRLGFDVERPVLDVSRFRAPPGPGEQGRLFG